MAVGEKFILSLTVARVCDGILTYVMTTTTTEPKNY